MDKVLIDVWGYRGFLVPEQYAGRRVGWTDTWYRSAPGSNPYANPVNGLHCVVDLNTMELLEIEDTFSVEKPAGTMGEYVPRFVPDLRLRTTCEPIEITQPDGVSFTLDGHALTWQNWSLRLGFNHREGLVLHTLGFAGRSVAHRISLAEMVVPYRDPSPDHYRRTAYDIGEWGLGFMTTSLELGCDCLGEIRYVDAVLHDTAGEPYVIKNAICIHEEDDGVLWKHVDHVEGAEVRRARRLVISVHVTVANYEYLVYWRLYQDGSIECHVRATGIMVVGHLPEGEPARHGTMVDQRTYAPFHQHFLIARLDMDVDGPGEHRAHGRDLAPPATRRTTRTGSGCEQVSERLVTEGFQDYKWETQRGWKVVNEGVAEPRRHAGRLQARARARRCRTCCPRTRRCCGPPRRCATRSGSRPTRRTSAGRAGTSRTSPRSTPACPPGPPRAARSRTPTSCSGTSSASTTSRAWRTGRSCPWTRSPSG